MFADPKTDFVFQRIFGSEDHKPALLGFLNDLLELDDAHRIQSVSLLSTSGPWSRERSSATTQELLDLRSIVPVPPRSIGDVPVPSGPAEPGHSPHRASRRANQA